MYKNIVSTIVGCCLSLGLLAQSTSIENVLEQIEQNNTELKALTEYTENRKLELKTGNNLPDPQLGAYYLPFGEHSSGDYSEFEISQSFEFPTSYFARASLIDQQMVLLELDHKVKRQEILAQAKSYCLNLIYLSKRLDIEKLRVKQSGQVFEQVQKLYDKGQVGILELNKAKVAWMQEQFKIQQLDNDRENLLLLLTHMNGNQKVSFLAENYESALNLEGKESTWKVKQMQDPELAQLQQQEVIALQAIKLTRNKGLPNLTAGFNSQGVAGERFSGIYAGISIPLWSNHNQVKAAQSQVDYQQAFTSSKTSAIHSAFEKQYNGYEIMYSQYLEYESTLAELNSEKLLLQAYQLGEMSFLEYYAELQFYRQAYDAMLEMQYELYISQNQILKHQL